MRRLPFPFRARALLAAVIVLTPALVAASASTTVAAAREIAPAQTAPPEPVTADLLPTVQIDGVVWDTAIIGDRVYAVGEFSHARPAGADPGVDEIPRNNILAFDLHTGELVTTWEASLNAEGRTIEGSADGERIYVGGHFTVVNGQPRHRVAALDAETGALIDDWAPEVNSAVLAVAVSADTVYLGGTFTVVNGHQRLRLASVEQGSGGLLPWDPEADLQVDALAVHEPSGRVIAAGRFGELGGEVRPGSGSFDGATGEVMPWAAKDVIPNGGKSNIGISTIKVDGDVVYGAGWHHEAVLPDGSTEGPFAIDVLTGEVLWVNGCFGDVYDVASAGDVLYTVGHEHDCGAIGSHKESPTWTYQFARAVDRRGSSTGLTNAHGPFKRWFQQAGRPAADPLHWYPDFSAGSHTGKHQAGWTIEGADDIIVVGGEFPSVDGVAQQGLARYTTASAGAAKDAGPTGYHALAPTFRVLDTGRVRVEWTAAWDPDDAALSYELLRGPQIHDSEVVGSWTGASDPWQRPPMAAVLVDAPAGEHRYRIRVSDDDGNRLVSAPTSFATPTDAATPSLYHDRVGASGALHHWRLGESGGTVRDWIGANDLQIWSQASYVQDGALVGDDDTAVVWPWSWSTDIVGGVSEYWQTAPQHFSLEAWFKTGTGTGGKLIGFGGRRNGRSSSDEVDRHIYMADDGRVIFGVRPDFGERRTIESPPGFNDGQWHHVAATLDGAGTALYLDGEIVASDATVTGAQVNSGYWRVAGDNLTGWSHAPSSEGFEGTLDELAVYPHALTSTEVRAHFDIGTGRGEPDPILAADSFDRDVTGGWGSADLGGSWSRTWPSQAYHVADGEGHITVDAPGQGRTAYLGDVAAADVDITVEIVLDKRPTGTGTYVGVIGRSTSPGTDVVAKTRFLQSGAVQLSIVRRTGYAEETLASTTVPGLHYQAGHKVRLGFQAIGDNLRAAVWSAYDERPTDWLLAVRDEEADPEAHGSIGLWAYVATSATDTPVTVSIDDLHADSDEDPLGVDPEPAPDPGPAAVDPFERSVDAGWGSADSGGRWQRTWPSSAYRVADGGGHVSIGAPGESRSPLLDDVSVVDMDLFASLSLDTDPTGGGTYAGVVGRSVSPGTDYLTKARFLESGSVHLSIVRRVGYSETTLAWARVPDLQYSAGDVVNIGVQISGDDVRAVLWPASQERPPWLLSVTDSTPELRGEGTVGVWAYVDQAATQVPVTITVNDFRADALAPPG